MTLSTSRWGRAAFSGLVLLLAGLRPGMAEAAAPGRPTLAVQVGHSRPATGVSFSPDGRRLVSGSTDGTVKLWDPATGVLQQTLRMEGTEGSFGVAFSPDGQRVASAGTNGSLRVWDAARGTLLYTTREHRTGIRALAFNSTGDLLATGSADQSIKLWEAATGKLRATLAHGSDVRAVAFSPDGNWLAGGGVDGTVKLWKVGAEAPERVLNSPERFFLNALRFSPDGKTLAVAANNSRVYLWDAAAGKVARTLEHAAEPLSLAFSADGKRLTSGGTNGTLRTWDLATGGHLQDLRGKKSGYMRSVAFAPEGGVVASADEDGTVRLWDTEPAGLRRELSGGKPVYSVSFGPGNRLLAASEMRLRQWDGEGGRLLRTLDDEWEVIAAAPSPNGKWVAAGGMGGSVRLWDSATGRPGPTFRHGPEVLTVRFSPDSKTLATAGYGSRVKLWDVTTGALRHTLTGHEDWVLSLAFSPDGKHLASASLDGTLRLWKTATGAPERTLEHEAGVRASAFSPDGKTVAGGDVEGTVRWWNAATGKPERTTRLGEIVNSVAFRPDGMLAAGGMNGTVQLWNAAGKPVRTLRHEAAVYSLAFSGSGALLACGTDDGTVRLWPGAGEPVTLLVSTEDPEAWLAATAAGYYTASPGAGRLIRWKVGAEFFPVEAYERTFHRPDLVRKVLRGAALPSAPPAQRFSTGEAVPPQVLFITPSPGARVTGDVLEVQVTATDDRAITRLDLRLNGRPISAKPIVSGAKPLMVGAKPLVLGAKPVPSRHTLAREFKASIPLPPGESSVTLRAVAYDDENLQGWEEVTLSRAEAAPAPGNLYLLAVGVSRYRNPRFNLKYAAADAQAFAGLWSRRERVSFGRVQVTHLLDQQATRAELKTALAQLVAQAGPRDTVGVFLSGHGLAAGEGEFYFATHDVDPARPAATALPWTDLQSTLAKLNARRVLLFLDACHSGNALGGQQADAERMAELLVKRAGVLVFASSRGSEYSYELDEAKHGAFTQALVEGLGEGKADLDAGGGRDGVVNVEELLTYLRARVPRLTENRQTPTCPLLRDFGEPFPLIRVSR